MSDISKIYNSRKTAYQLPEDFIYRDVFLKGRPVHDRNDSFYARHPPMPPSRWAKIFSPFDALKGFDDAVSSKEVTYESRRTLDEDAQTELDSNLNLLTDLVRAGKASGKEPVQAAITYYSPCSDTDNEAYGHKGKYITKTGAVTKIDTQLDRTLRIDGIPINLDDIIEICIFQ